MSENGFGEKHAWLPQLVLASHARHVNNILGMEFLGQRIWLHSASLPPSSPPGHLIALSSSSCAQRDWVNHMEMEQPEQAVTWM